MLVGVEAPESCCDFVRRGIATGMTWRAQTQLLCSVTVRDLHAFTRARLQCQWIRWLDRSLVDYETHDATVLEAMQCEDLASKQSV